MRLCTAAVVAALSAAPGGVAGARAAAVSAPMNPGATYTIANALDNTTLQAYRGEYFELLSAVQTTQYSEVRWTPLTQPLPADIVKRFDGKVMVVTGYEVDIVRGDGGGDNLTSVPCFEQYNHHFSATMSGKLARPAEDAHAPQATATATATATSTVADDVQVVLGGHGEALQAWDVAGAGAVLDGVPIPSVQAFSEGNGNEHRGSWHGYPVGYGQLIYSPTTWTTNPMIINTNKRLTSDRSPGPINHKLVPSSVLSPPDSAYSGILECPCTTRIVKVLDGYSIQRSGPAPAGSSAVLTAAECAAAVEAAGVAAADGQVQLLQSAAEPAGCFASAAAPAASSGVADWRVFFNAPPAAAAAAADCGSGRSGGGDVLAAGVWNSTDSGVVLRLALTNTTARIEVETAADGNWFGVAFGATSMADSPYAIVVEPNLDFSEYSLGDHAAGHKIHPTLTLVRSIKENGRQIVTFTRDLRAWDDLHYAFDPNATEIDVLGAHGTAQRFSYHGSQRAAGTLTLAPPNTSLCLRRNASNNAGTIAGRKFNPGVCAPYPMGELVTTHNPICNVSEYGGGLYCCSGGTFLLDADQAVPEPADAWRMRYRFYFEEYNSSGTSASASASASASPADGNDAAVAAAAESRPLPQSNVFRVWWSTEATNNEYDVPKSPWNCADPATPAANCTHTLVSRFTGRDMLEAQCMVGGAAAAAACGNATKIEREDDSTYNLIYAAAHCHSPACIDMELWDDDTGELLCRNQAVYGTGGTQAQNESSYIVAIPPCVWGSAVEGLRPPPAIRLDSNLSCVKHANATNGHWGTMALWQMRGAYVRK